ncbi:NodT family efflux transporter outer membrane factor (OMF) lipoprotein [Sphingopyxis panaciterrae]|uniref:efflux transporter outer membrane subunit n=1 Tax=Sphingopyxis panaciterrae TaxID=363841 RepID=UPI001ABB24C5|nr:efflux transporter outer membrane subunit [Sphingopyxis panaciterrae]NIJ38140.1 NodT family efflux transporter outer membrane factor (OMF) lipoprotein [Sphingopyxis panaciterrae]
MGIPRSVLLLPLLLAGCMPTLTPRPEASNIAPPAGWRTAMPATATSERDWWSGFGDTQLAALVEQARANNADLAIAAARIAEARAQEHVARSLLMPTLSVNAPGAESRSLNPFGVATESFAAQPAFQAAYEVDLFGRNAAQVDAAGANAAAVAAAREAAVLSVSAATASGYITLLALDERHELLRQTLASRAEALRIARDRAEAGYTSQLELRQAEAEYRAAEQQIPAIEAAIARQENALSQLVGDTPHAIARGRDFAALTRPAVPDVLPSDLVRRRPDIAQAEYALAATDANLRVARAQFLPQVRLSASAGAVISSALPDPVSIWSIGGSILAPLFQGGRLQGQFDAATAQRDQAAFAYRRAVLTAFREVEDQLAVIDRLGAQEQALLAQRAAVADALRHATNRYRAGYSPYLEQIDAQRALLAVDLALIQLHSDRLTAYVALYQALGGSGTATAPS